MNTSSDCIFCKIAAGRIPSTKVYEDEKSLVFMDISPLNPGHLLIIPKEHFETIFEIPQDLYSHLNRIACETAKAIKAALEPDGLNILQLNGKAANQVVPHLHIHLTPRWEGDGLTISEWEPVMGDIDEILRISEKIKKHLALP